MKDAKAELTDALRTRGLLDERDPLLVAWSGRLTRLDGEDHDVPATEHPPAILGLTNGTGHLLSRAGLVTFALAEVTAVHTHRDRLGWVISADGRAPMRIELVTDMPVAMATQLGDMSRAAARGVRYSEPVGAPAVRRHPAKRRSNEQ